MTTLSPTWAIIMAAAAVPPAVPPAPPPAPHARKKPDITLPMLESLDDAAKPDRCGIVYGAGAVIEGLIRRGLAVRTPSG
mgnify:CR=1 FL=1